MQIHVVQPGDSLWQISQTYSTPLERIVQTNQIPNPSQLVVGQTIVIPIWGSYHWVQPGESLFQIAQQYGTTVDALLQINRIPNPDQIWPGLRLYIPQQEREVKDVSAYIEIMEDGTDEPPILQSVAPHLTYVTIFSYELNPDGTLNPIPDQPTINTAYQNRVVPIMVITNIEEGGFNTELATTILSDEDLQDRVLNEAMQIMNQKGYLGLDFDLEFLGEENRERYNQFLRKAQQRLDEQNYLLSTAIPPKVSGEQEGVLYEGHDYAAHGEIADKVFVMTYEWGWSGGPPMAVAPLDQVRRVIEYAASQIPNEKVMMGIPLYGYDWTLPYEEGGEFARAISPQEAIELAAQYNAAIEYDETAQSPFFNYVDEEGNQHEVWFEDARSIQAKFDLIKAFNLGGFFYWVLRFEFPQNWLLIQDNFLVRKRV
ncbi:glycosyl hydrolase family 18 protein [Caldalkalibacillus salinus]|uniref:glycosyl hydrolase family 18 protein n=1 Tax=Caldalkalibacillus salinus TaxID=2803787 RepID=UPI0019226938|nr:glycoside hydrolase family 18 protein [Caldalkalibacillus salinus]